MKELLQILTELFRIFRSAFSEAKRKTNEKEIRDVKEAIKNTDLNKLRDSVLDRK